LLPASVTFDSYSSDYIRCLDEIQNSIGYWSSEVKRVSEIEFNPFSHPNIRNCIVDDRIEKHTTRENRKLGG